MVLRKAECTSSMLLTPWLIKGRAFATYREKYFRSVFFTFFTIFYKEYFV